MFPDMQSFAGYRILTIRQPWPDLITADALMIEQWRITHPQVAQMLPKDIENRGWGTDWRGTILAHAGLKPDREAMQRFGFDPKDFTYGAVVGTARLVDIVTDSTSPWADRAKKHWKLDNQQRLAAKVSHSGDQGLLPVPAKLLADVLANLPGAVYA